MKPKKKIYFAHPFKMKGSMSEHEISTIIEDSGYEVIEPFEDEKIILHKHGLKSYYDNPRKDIAGEIFRRDFNHIMVCDELVAWFPREIPCIGTAIELLWAYNADKYTYVISPVRHPFLLSMTDFIYPSIEEFRKSFKEDAKFGG